MGNTVRHKIKPILDIKKAKPKTYPEKKGEVWNESRIIIETSQTSECREREETLKAAHLYLEAREMSWMKILCVENMITFNQYFRKQTKTKPNKTKPN